MRNSRLFFATAILVCVTTEAYAGLPCTVETFLRNNFRRDSDRRVCRQADAGTVHVAVLSVAPWEEYVSALQPVFQLTVDQALQDVVPQTGTLDESIFRALAASAKIALPTSTQTQSATDSTNAGTTTSTSTSTTSSGPGDLDKVPAPPSGPASTAAANLAAASTTALGFDPMMRRWAATALYQEVQLLNRYVIDAAVPQRYRPYVVRLQITLMPSARREPYDTYATISFLSGDLSSNISYSKLPKATRPLEAGAAAALLRQWVETGAAERPDTVPRVVPLLVTDNLESTRHSEASEQVRQISASLLLMAQNVGVSGGVQKQLDRIQKSLSNDFNSLLTVARLSENSVRARLGALQTNGRYAMIPRTHNITILLMVPEEAQSVSYISKATMQDAVDGDLLSPGRSSLFGWRFEKVIEQWVTDYQLPNDTDAYIELKDLAQAGNYILFRDHLVKSVFPLADQDMKARLSSNIAFREAVVSRMWVDISNFNGTGQYSQGSFELPRMDRTSRCFFPPTAVSFLDDTTSVATVQLRGARFIDYGRVRARLKVTKGGRDYFIDAASVSPGKRADEAQVTLPSVWKLLGLEAQKDPLGPFTDERAIQDAALLLSYAPSPYRWGVQNDIADPDILSGHERSFPATFIFVPEKKATVPGFTLSASSTYVLSNNGIGAVKISLRKSKDAPDKMFFLVRGGDVTTMTPMPQVEKEQMFAATDATIDIALRNLTPLADVVVSAFATKDGVKVPVDDVRFRVLDITPQAPSKRSSTD